jgi:hypothetical protein
MERASSLCCGKKASAVGQVANLPEQWQIRRSAPQAAIHGIRPAACHWWPVLVAVGAMLAGCDHRPTTFPVDGKVTYTDGAPLAGGTVEFLTTTADGQRINARGRTDLTGAFTLGTFAEDDGALAGRHQAIVVGRPALLGGDLTRAPHLKGIDPRFANYETSGLTFVVKPGENHFAISVAREGSDTRPRPQSLEK